MKPPVDAPTSRQTRPRVDAEGVQRRGQLVAAPADVWLGRGDLDRRLGIDEVARLPVESRLIAGPDPNLAADQQRLGTGARFGEPPVDDELVEPNPVRTHTGHRLMVAYAASPRLILGGFGWRDLRRGRPRQQADDGLGERPPDRCGGEDNAEQQR